MKTTAASPLTVTLLVIASATLAGALAFEHIGGLLPCPLCLQQRIPYWSALPLCLLALLAFRWKFFALGAGMMSLVALGFALGSALGVYHAGIEWHWWEGPATCSGTAPPANIDALLEDLEDGGALVRCDEAAWRLLGISLSGYNALISIFLSGLGVVAAKESWRAR